MDWLEILYKIFEVCVIPLLGILTTYIVKFINIKTAEITSKTQNELANKYIVMLSETISECVVATNQTYVDALKAKGEFDLEAQKAAFEMTYQSVLAVLSNEAKQYLAEVYGDLTAYITKKIEAEVKFNK